MALDIWYLMGTPKHVDIDVEKKFGGKIQNGIFYLSRSVIVKLHHIIIFIRWLQQIIVFFPSSPSSSSYGYFWSAWIIFPNNIYQPISNSVGVLKYEIFTEETMLIFALRKVILSFVVYLYVWGNMAKNSWIFVCLVYVCLWLYVLLQK